MIRTSVVRGSADAGVDGTLDICALLAAKRVNRGDAGTVPAAQPGVNQRSSAILIENVEPSEARRVLGQFEAFVEIARTGSLRKAALNLHLSEPAVSARIASLEADVGSLLFQRGKRGMTLTVAGRALLPHAVQVLDSVDAGRRTVADVSQGRDGEVVIGSGSSIAAYIIPDVVAAFRQIHPGIGMIVRTRPSPELVDAVVGGRIQVGLVGALLDDRVQQTPLYDEDLILVAGPASPFAGDDPADLTALRSETLVLFDRGCSYDEAARAALRTGGVTPGAVIEVDTIETARALVARNAGVCFMPATAVVRSIGRGDVVAVPVDGLRAPRVRVVAIEPVGARPWGPVDTIKDLLQAAARRNQGTTAPAS
jgi:DNA-binding transcriptional LysR family regulator